MSKKEKSIKVNENKNITWQRNHLIIMQGYKDLQESTGGFPSIESVAKHVGLNFNTVQKHAQSLTIANVSEKYKLAGEMVAESLLRNIKENGKGSDVIVYNKLVYGYKEAMEVSGKDLITSIKVNIIKPK